MPYKLAIIGSRNFSDWPFILEKFSELVNQDGFPSHIVSSGASGADAMAERLAKLYSTPTIIHYAQWDKHGKSAGPMRNALIEADADMVLAFPVGASIGTNQCLSLFRKSGKPIYSHLS